MKPPALNKTAKFAVFDAAGKGQKPQPTAAAAARASGGRLTTGAAKSVSAGKIGGEFAREPTPVFASRRDECFERAKALRAAEAVSAGAGTAMVVTLANGAEKPGVAFQTTPLDIAKSINQKLGKEACVARVTYDKGIATGPKFSVLGDEDPHAEEAEAVGELWDMTRPLEGSCRLELFTFDSKEGKMVFWHSAAHLLGAVLEQRYGAKLCVGPPVEGGFYYDAYMGETGVSDTEFKEMNQSVVKIVNAKVPFERLSCTKDELLDMFAENPFKLAIISTKIPDGARTTVYRSGPIVDLCMGPHVPDSGRIKAFEIQRASSAYWLGQAENDALQRVYGIAFPDKKQLTQHNALLAEAAKRDHRRIGTQQKLFFFDALSPGSAFFEPHGARIHNGLIEFIREQYWLREYTEVVTPNVYNFDLWHTSGHALHYKDDMFCFDVEGAEFGLKPMNCPGHCVMFAKTVRSWRDLPMRYADFGVLHRNELSGALSGLTRVRRFQQDDAHIFCRADQVEEEVKNSLEFMKYVYDTFGMTYKLELSTRPAKALGDVAVWDKAEKSLANAMDAFAGKDGWKVNPGDGAFYGPKIDIKVTDALQRRHQCATIQLDFQLPIRFDLKYRAGGDQASDQGDEHRPIIIHRAMLGSVERMIAVLTEHWGGKWPFWISPRQVVVVPVLPAHNAYAAKVRTQIRAHKFFVDVDDSGNTLPKKVRNAQLAQYNFILVVGDEELKAGTVAVRTRNNTVEGTMPIADFITRCADLQASKAMDDVPQLPSSA